jgi:hypothetical protein
MKEKSGKCQEDAEISKPERRAFKTFEEMKFITIMIIFKTITIYQGAGQLYY